MGHNNLSDCINDTHLDNGGRIFIENGCYEIEDDLSIADLALQIVGIGDSVEIKFIRVQFPVSEIECGLYLCGESKVLLRNLQFSFPKEYPMGVLVGDEAMMWMEGCTLHHTVT